MTELQIKILAWIKDNPRQSIWWYQCAHVPLTSQDIKIVPRAYYKLRKSGLIKNMAVRGAEGKWIIND